MIQFHHGHEGSTFIIYRLDMIGDGFVQPLHVGCLPWSVLTTLADAKEREGWATLINRRDKLALTVLGQSDDRATAQALRTFHEAATTPRPALADSPMREAVSGPRSGPIRCVETGETWRTSAALARELGVNPSAVSLHLSRVIKVLQGRTYVRTTTTQVTEAPQ